MTRSRRYEGILTETTKGKLVIGGRPVRRKPFSVWPVYPQKQARAIRYVLTNRN